ncbi:helix-turn-helix transcriptional regulator [Pseudofrankia sp. BMG5.36]|uniref:helix-turn-helix domain-containing protein n=1 Tax=Pseudofrankia sp. BMG5.36 TaxID=1834512 RepID=UPI0008D9629A|nr:helix-turn-helix transcriptional regulator [Pseudofrankia sp. BMG5.36]OHV64176.1 transcriptional regulator [Pseudofrankia sp. BMG5.36]
MPPSSSSAQQARQLLADRLRDLRRDAGLTAVELAVRAGWERTKVSKIEHATRPPSAADIRAWCQICGVENDAADLIASLHAAEGMWVEWRRMERSGLRRAQEARLPLYERTRQFRAYSCWIVPGLIQTEDYTRAVLRAYQQRRGLHDDVEAAVAARMKRQRVLRRNQRTAVFLVEESVLRNGFGGPAVMRGQLAHLAEVTTWPAVSLGVIPASPDRGMAGAAEDFWIFDNEQVNVELISGHLTVTQPTEIGLYAQMFARFGEIAVYGSRARDLFASTGRQL